MKNVILISLVCIFTGSVILTGCKSKVAETVKPSATLTLAAPTCMPGCNIKVSFAVTGPFDSLKSWIGILPADIPHGKMSVNDENDLAYFYLEGKRTGEFEFQAPGKPGKYDFRLSIPDSNGIELATVPFTVSEPGQGTLPLAKSSFKPGEEIKLVFTANAQWCAHAWVGLLPADAPHGDEAKNDELDLSYEYLNSQASGELTFTAPDKPGKYDFRMHSTDYNGQELISVAFEVK
jgi:hypothetical protein